MRSLAASKEVVIFRLVAPAAAAVALLAAEARADDAVANVSLEVPPPALQSVAPALTLAPTPAPKRPRRLVWDSSWPRFRIVEYAATITSYEMLAFIEFRMKLGDTPNFTGGILFDDAFRSVFRLHDCDGRIAAAHVADVLALSAEIEPIVASTLPPLVDCFNLDVGWQLVALDFEAQAFTGLSQRSLMYFVKRARPDYNACKANWNYGDCGGLVADFPSGHSSSAFAGAGTSCAHHLHLPLYGGGAPDILACIVTLAAATGVGFSRLMSDDHWATDVIVGSSIRLLLRLRLADVAPLSRADSDRRDAPRPGDVRSRRQRRSNRRQDGGPLLSSRPGPRRRALKFGDAGPIPPFVTSGSRTESSPSRAPWDRAPTRPDFPAVRRSGKTTRPVAPSTPPASICDDDLFDEEDVPTAVSRPSSRIEPGARDAGALIRLDGISIGEVIPLHEGATTHIGRSRDAAIKVDDDGVSRLHAAVHWRDGQHILVDCGSRNGVVVDGRAVKMHTLRDGDIIHLSSRTSFRFVLMSHKERDVLQRLFESSVRDPLTGAGNRAHFDERLAAEVAYAKRHGSAMSLVLVDIDHFKRVNDEHGHQAGDAALKYLAAMASSRLRVEDVFARYGGEEFGVILRGIDVIGAARAAERLRSAIGGSTFAFAGCFIPLTISAGCASLACCATTTGEALIEAADRRLYAAKRAGRNRVVGSGP